MTPETLPMSQPVQVLLVENSKDDALLLAYRLEPHYERVVKEALSEAPSASGSGA